MAILVMCINPQCGEMMNAPDGSAGKQARCPACGTVQTVPGAAPDINEPAASPSADDERILLDELILAPLLTDQEPETPLAEPAEPVEPADQIEAFDDYQPLGEEDDESITLPADEDVPDRPERAGDDSTFFEMTDLDEELSIAAEARRSETLGTAAGLVAVFGLGLLGSVVGFAAGVIYFDDNSFLWAYGGSVAGWVAGFVVGLLAAVGMDDFGHYGVLGDESGPDMMLRDCLRAPQYQSSSFTGIFVLVIVSLVAHMIGWMLWTLTIDAISGDWDPSLRATLAVMGLLAEFLFIGYFLGVCVEIVRGGLTGGDSPPGVGGFNPLRMLISAAQGASLVALYVLPVLTLPLLPLGIISLAHADGLGAGNLLWARRAVVRRPAQLVVLWLLLMLWTAVLGCVLASVIWAGKRFMPVIPASATYTDIMVAGVGYALMALVFSVAGAVLVCAMFHCIGIFGRENRDMIADASKRATRQTVIFSAVALVIFAAVFCLIGLDAVRAFF